MDAGGARFGVPGDIEDARGVRVKKIFQVGRIGGLVRKIREDQKRFVLAFAFADGEGGTAPALEKAQCRQGPRRKNHRRVAQLHIFAGAFGITGRFGFGQIIAGGDRAVFGAAAGRAVAGVQEVMCDREIQGRAVRAGLATADQAGREENLFGRNGSEGGGIHRGRDREKTTVSAGVGKAISPCDKYARGQWRLDKRAGAFSAQADSGTVPWE